VNNFQAGQQLLQEAELDLERVRQEFKQGRWNRVMRASQEAVEHSLKGLLKMMGVEYPKIHDVGNLLQKVCKDRGLGIKEQVLRQIAEISSYLANEGSLCFYMERKYSQQEAEVAMRGAEKVLQEARQLAKRLQRK